MNETNLKKKLSIYNYSRSWFESYFQSKGLAKFRATQVYEGIYRQKVSDFDSISNLNKDVKQVLKDNFEFNSLNIVKKNVSPDGTTKFLFALADGNLIETVLMNQSYGYSVCVTSQVGCNMGCYFCASGETKKIRNLEPSEMLLQVLTVDNYLQESEFRVSHVVVMGIGEPFDNYDNVIEFIKIINDAKGLEIGSRHITVSTCGLVPKIIEFAELPLQVNLAISLHFPNDKLRDKYMPINHKYNLRSLFDSLKIYYEKTQRRITFEYILLDGINDSIECAKELCLLIKGCNCYINLIPYNQTSKDLARTSERKRDAFFNYLNKQGVNAIVRKEHGTDIDAACGQLRVKTIKKDND